MRFLRLTPFGGLASLQRKKERFGLIARLVLWTGAGMLGAVLSGCAGLTVESSTADKDKVITERAEARWQLLIKGDVDGAYQYLSAGSKATTSQAVYKSKIKPGIWRSAKVSRVECEAELCKVEVTVTYDFRNMHGLETPVPETWIIENGSAWYVYRP